MSDFVIPIQLIPDWLSELCSPEVKLSTDGSRIYSQATQGHTYIKFKNSPEKEELDE